MIWLQAVVLGVVQGLTEFLPVSSSGHLILVPQLFHWPDQGLAFDTILHLGTLVALLWFFRADIGSLLRGIVSKESLKRTESRRICAQIIIASLPALVLGAALQHTLELYDRVAWLVAIDLAFWACVLWYADSRARKEDRKEGSFAAITWKQALIIGCSQVLALLPGTSRSGMTITAGLFTGLSRAQAARFSFFLSIPVTAAAGGYGLLKWATHPTPSEPASVLLIGFLAALVCGAWAIRFLLRYVSQHSYVPFVLYRLALALLVVCVLVR